MSLSPQSALPRTRVAAMIFGLAFVEWRLFELRRTPYRPPYDMSTFLGTEKYAVIRVMLGLAVCGIGGIAWWAARFSWTRRDVASLGGLVALLIVVGSLVVFHPSWPVTPLQWVMH